MNKTQAYYDGIARGYKELYHEEQIKKIHLIKHLLPLKGKLLDAGSGDGVLNEFLSSSEELVSCDISSELLKLNSNSNKVQANLENLPFQDNEFDCICSFSVLQDIENFSKAIKEFSRVLKPQGQTILSFIQISKKKEQLLRELNKYFTIQEKINEEKDLILVLEKK